MSETNAQKLDKWLQQSYPETVRVTSRNRGSTGNHSHDNAIDVAGIENLPEEEQERIFKTAMSMGLRVGEELSGKQGVGGWTGAHYHFDGTKFKNLGDALVHFTRGSETGQATNKRRNAEENKKNAEFVKRMNKLAKEPIKYGPTDEEIKYKAGTPSEPERTPDATKVSRRDESFSKADFLAKTALYAQMQPESGEIENQVKAVDEFFDQGYNKDELLASTDAKPQRATDSMPETPSVDGVTEEPLKWQDVPRRDLGAQPFIPSKPILEEINDLTIEGMGDDLINKFTDRNAIGLITQEAISAFQQTDKIDPSFNIKGQDNELYTQMTEGLEADDIVEILDNSFNRADFIKNSSLAQGRMKRTQEMQRYSENHPVLSGVNTVSNMLTEGAAFMPVSTLIAGAAGATKVKLLSDLTRTGMRSYALGEVAEQGIQEIIWSKFSKDYEFDPILFASGIGVGVGLKTIVGSPEVDKMFRDFLKNEDGFINIATKEGKRLVDEVADKVGDKQAIALASRITKKKIKVANEIRKNLEARRTSLVRRMGILDKKLSVAKLPEDIKKFKGMKQKVTRQLKSFDKKLPEQLDSLARGTHPKLLAEVNPEFKISTIAKELDIPHEQVNTLEKARKFLGLDLPEVDPNFIMEGEKNYQAVMRGQLQEMAGNKRLNMNETLRYAAGSGVVKSIDELPILGKLQVGDKLRALAETDGPVSRFLFNKGNLVSSNNPYVASLYNFFSPDGMGRQGMSKIRAIESQQKYANIYGGDLMNIYHSHGNKIFEALNDSTVGTKVKGFLSPDAYEEAVEPLLKERLLDVSGETFRAKYGNKIADAADDFYADFNKLNKKIVDRAKELGVEGVDFDATEGWFHRSWDFRKARAVDPEDLSDTVFRAMKSHVETLGAEVAEDELRKHAKKFAYGLRNADLTEIEGMQSDHIKLLEKLLNKSEGVEQGVIKDEVSRLKMLKAKADAGDLANRVQMDVTQRMSNGMALSDLFEDNVVHTQKRYTGRMAARIAAAEHGIKNIDDIDDWINDAVDYEIKSLAEKGVKNPRQKAKFIEDALRQDFMSFKYGGMVGLHDLPDDTASDFLRLVKKYNYARLMQYTGISSIAELGGTFVEAGVSNTLGEMGRYMRNHFNDLYMDNPDMYVGRLYDELRTITGVGMEDFSFSTKGMSKASRVFTEGTLSKVEQGIDVLGRTTQAPFGGIERAGRRITANALAIKWGNHFKGTESGGILSAFFGSNGVTNRVLENSGFGLVDSAGKFIPNDNYKAIKKAMNSFADFDDSGRLIKLNLEKWDTNTAHAFGDAIQMQANHIMVNPDSTTMALWQSSTIGQILNQFRTFTVNATTKVFGQAVGNAAISSNRGDHSELIKAGQKIFWGTSLGMLSVALRQGIQRAGGDREIDLFDEGLIKAAAIGFSRSSVAGNLPTISDSISGSFGYDPIFDKTSSVGRSKNFFNLATTPTGQAIGGAYTGIEKGVQGDFKGAGMQLLKMSPVYRQIGAQQLFNFIDNEK